jgi:hypothetical protein
MAGGFTKASPERTLRQLRLSRGHECVVWPTSEPDIDVTAVGTARVDGRGAVARLHGLFENRDPALPVRLHSSVQLATIWLIQLRAPWMTLVLVLAGLMGWNPGRPAYNPS